MHVLSCFILLKSVLFVPCMFWIFFQNAGSQLCFRFFCFVLLLWSARYALRPNVEDGRYKNPRLVFEIIIRSSSYFWHMLLHIFMFDSFSSVYLTVFDICFMLLLLHLRYQTHACYKHVGLRNNKKTASAEAVKGSKMT